MPFAGLRFYFVNYCKWSHTFCYFYTMIRVNIDIDNDINKITAEFQKAVKVALVDFGTKVETDAKNDAPADEGRLRNSINSVYRDGQVTITAASNYAAFMEFGTRKFAAKYVATLPQDWKAYAATFRGDKTGGTFDQFVKAIMAWVRRKGIGADLTKSGNVSNSASSLDKQQEAAYWIALNILQNGIRPKPFLYPAVKKHTPDLIKDIQNALK